MSNITQSLKENWGSALTVALISFPLSLSIAISSGVGPMTGLIAGIWGGLLGGRLLGTRLIIVGVGASIINIQTGFLDKYSQTISGDTASYVALMTLVSGLFLLLIRVLGLQKLIKYVSNTIITGFAAGIGAVLISKQLPEVFGVDSLSSIFSGAINYFSLVLFLVSFGLLFIFQKLLPKVPSAIPVSILGIIFGYLSNQGNWSINILQDKFSDLSPKLFDIPNFASLTLNNSMILDILINGFLIASVIVLESLITARFVQKDSNEKIKSYPNKDVVGLGIINIIVGFLGGMPVLSLISRTSANLQQKATNNTSVFLYGGFMAILTLVLIPFIRFYPFAVIASILIKVALPLINIEEFKKDFTSNKFEFIVAVLVSTLVFFYNAFVAVLVGVICSLLIQKFSNNEKLATEAKVTEVNS